MRYKYVKFNEQQFNDKLALINSILFGENEYNGSYCYPLIIGEDYYMVVLDGYDYLFEGLELLDCPLNN